MKNGKYLFALFSVFCVLFRQVNAGDVEINNQQPNTSAKISNAEANVSAESGKYFSVQNDISSNLLDRFPELTTIINKIVINESKVAPSSNEDISHTSMPEVTERVVETSPKSDLSTNSLTLLTFSPNQNNDYQARTNQNRYQPSIVLGYKPITSFYHPRPVTLAQIVPQGTPWPDSKEGYKTTFRSTIENKANTTQKVEEHTTSRVEIPQSTKVDETVSQNIIPAITVLDYKPITSFHHPHPITPAQIVPTGIPWPDSVEGYETSIGTKPKPSTVSKPESSTQHVIPPAIILDYKPITSFHHPHPITPAQIVPTGTPWPDSNEGYQTSIAAKPKPSTVSKTTAKEVESSTQHVIPPAIILGYKPITSFYHPHPVTLGQIVPAGTPWPDSVEGYQTSSGTKPPTSTNKVDEQQTTKNQKTTVKKEESSTQHVIPPAVILEYQPITSFFHPNPVTPAQIIPPGTPWPDSIEGYQTSIGTKPPASTNKVNEQQTTIKKDESSTQHVILEYQPVTSFFHPNPVTPAQVIPSGTPWPDSIEGYTKPSTLSSKVDEEQTTLKNKQTTASTTTSQEVESSTQYVTPPVSVLDYKPITSFYHPHPITLPQIIPSGTPWPDSVEGYKTSIGTNQVNKVPITQEPTVGEVESNTNNLISAQTDLDYKPVTSFFHPRPVTVAQIISPGKPWPDSSEGYETTTFLNKERNKNLTAMEHKYKPAAVSKIISSGIDWPYPAGINLTNLEQIFLNIREENLPSGANKTIEETEITTQKQLKTKPSAIVSDLLLENTKTDLVEPNPLQIEPDITDSANLTPIPFTSGIPKTTLSDIVDILTDVYNITLVNSSSTEKSSELSSLSSTIKIDLNYRDVLIPQENKIDKNNIPVLVYDGVPKSEETIEEERIFHNPKFNAKD